MTRLANQGRARCALCEGDTERMARKPMKAGREAADGSEMVIDERRRHILSLVRNQGGVLVEKLSRTLGISQITIRKDLEHLQSRGLIQRTHGGALRVQSGALCDPSLQEKQKQHAREKQRIADEAARIGPLAEDVLNEMHADILFLGVDGYDVETGNTTPNFLESRVNRAMVKASRRVMVVCDSTKFNRRSLWRIVPTSAIHCVITDKNIPREAEDALRSQNVELILV